MCFAVWVMLLLSISGYAQITAANLTTATDCRSAMDGFEAAAGIPRHHYTRLLSAFPSLQLALDWNPDPFVLSWNDTATPKTPQQAMDEFSSVLNRTALILEDLAERCSRPPGCPTSGLQRAIPFSPDVLWALRDLCVSEKGVDYFDSLGQCYVKVIKAHPSLGRIPWQADQDLGDSMENPKIACNIALGRKFVCRFLQISVSQISQPSGPNIAEICGQEAVQLALDFQKDAMRALRCAQFGDFVRTYGSISIDYRAAGSAH